MGNPFDILMSTFSSTPCIVFLKSAGSEGYAKRFFVELRAPGKGLYVVARNFYLALTGCGSAKHAYLFRSLCKRNPRNPILEGLFIRPIMLRFPHILGGRRNGMRGFHRPSRMKFLIFRLYCRALKPRETDSPNLSDIL